MGSLNVPTVILLVLIAVWFAGAVWFICRARKKKSGCCGNCAMCPNGAECRRSDKK